MIDQPTEGTDSDGIRPEGGTAPEPPAAAPWAPPGSSASAAGAPGSPWHPPGASQPGPPQADRPQPGLPSDPPAGGSPWPPSASGVPPTAPPPPGPWGRQPPGPGWGQPHAPQLPWQGQPAYGARMPLPPAGYQAPPKPGVIPLRPLGLGEILDGAFQACRRNPLATFGTAILLQAVVALVTVLLFGNLLSSFEVFDSPNPSTDSLIGAFASLGVFASVAGVVTAVALLVLQGILVIPIARAVINQKTGFGQAWRLARGRILPLLGFGLLSFGLGTVGLALLVGISALAIAGLQEYSALLIIPLAIGAVVLMIWVSMKLVVAPAALMLEGTGPWTSIRRSWSLTRGNWWRTFGIVLLTSIIVSVIASVISTPLTFAVSLFLGFSTDASTAPDALDSLPVIAATQAITALFTAIGYAFQAGVTSLLYVDLRIRREGFDVVLMREHERAGTVPSDILPGGTGAFGHQPGGPA